MNLNYTQSDFYHNSRLSEYRYPQGAVESGTKIRIRAKVSNALQDAYVFLVSEDETESKIKAMNCVEKNDDHAIFEVFIDIYKSFAGLIHYHFVINDGKSLCYYGGKSSSGELTSTESSRWYQISVFEPGFITPDWAKNAIFYHIFVDSFNKSGERGGLDRLNYHIDKNRKINIHENWNERRNFLPDEGAEHYDPNDFFGGDLNGVREKLPYLKELGISAIFLSPIFESPSNHKYNTSDYLNVDPGFGTNEDFVNLAKEANDMGIRIMLDGVFSHTGDDSIYFNRYGRYENLGAYRNKDSKYYDWYKFFVYPSKFDSWWGFQSLPNVNEMHNSFIDFIAKSEDSVIKRWLKMGASAWRLDVADELPDEFIAELRTACKQVGEDNMLLGEVWEDASNKQAYGSQRRYVFGNELDSVMNYPFRNAALSFINHKISSFDFSDWLDTLRENYPSEFHSVLLNLISSHDVPRALSLLGGAPDKDSGLDRETQAHFTLSESAKKTAITKLKLAVALQMVLPGAPCIYYGEEAGMEGLMDPFNRETFPWGNENTKLLEHYKFFTKLRNDNSVLRTGRSLLYHPHSSVAVIIRFFDKLDDNHDGAQCAIAIINRDANVIDFELDTLKNAEGIDSDFWKVERANFQNVFTDEELHLENGVLSVKAQGLSANVYFIKS